MSLSIHILFGYKNIFTIPSCIEANDVNNLKILELRSYNFGFYFRYSGHNIMCFEERIVTIR